MSVADRKILWYRGTHARHKRKEGRPLADPGLFGCIAALVWVLHRHGTIALVSAPRRGRLRRFHDGLLAATRWGVAVLGGAVFVVAVIALAGSTLPGLDGPILYLAGVGCALVALIGLEAAVFEFRRRVAAAAREALQRKRLRSVRTMMQLGLGPQSEPLR